MISDFSVRQLPKHVKAFVFAFLIALSFGYFTGFKMLVGSTHLTPAGIETNYLGNEDDEEAEEFKFKKSEREIISVIHSHSISFALIFFALGALFLGVDIPIKLKRALLVEPFISVIITFGGIWLLWKGVVWMKYVIIASGVAITLSFVLMVLILGYQLLQKPREEG